MIVAAQKIHYRHAAQSFASPRYRNKRRDASGEFGMA